MNTHHSSIINSSDQPKRSVHARRSIIPKIGVLIALVLFVLMTGIATAQPPSPTLPEHPFSWIGPSPDIGPVPIVEWEKELRVVRDFLQTLPDQQDPFEAIDACVQQEMEQKDVPGAAIAIAQDDEIVYERGYGVKHREEGGAVDKDTLFRIGSITKMMTAAAVMQQVEQGRVDLNAPVTRYASEFEVAGPWTASQMTVWNLLTHSTGFPDRLYLPDIDGPATPAALSNWADTQSEVQLYAPPSSFWNYSNPNFTLAGLVVQRASDMLYHEYMAKKVWARAGMTRTMLLPAEALAYDNYTYGHYPDPFTGEPVIDAPDAYDNWWAAPAGYAFSTPGDLVRWAQLLMDGGGDVLAPESAAAMQDEQIWMHYTPEQSYGYGVFTDVLSGVEIRHHGGNIPGWGAMMLWVPERDFAVSVLGNTTLSMNSSTVCATVTMLGLEQQEPPDYSTDPDTWDRYTGTYHVLDYFSTMDPAGFQYEAVVTKADNTLRLAFPTMPDPLHPTVPFSRTLEQAVLDTFLLDFDLDGQGDLDVTFIEDPEASDQTKWMRTRVFVGTKAAVPQGTDNLTARAFIDYRCDGFFQSGLDIPLRDAIVTLSFPNGARITRQVRSLGLVNFSGFDALDGVAVSIDLPESYKGYGVDRCPNSSTNVRLQSNDFRLRHAFVEFRAEISGEVAGP